MKRTVVVGAITGAVVLFFSLASALAEESARPAAGATRPSSAQTVRVVEAAGAPSAPAADAQSAPETPFSLEKLVIGVGLCAVIALAVFRWGKGTHQKKQDKGPAASGSPSA